MIGTNFSIRQCVALVLALGLIPLQLPAKDKKKQSEIDIARSAGLRVYVLEGKAAVNFIPSRKGTTPVVEVRDENELPVENASVEFRLPENGSGGEFEGG